LKEESKSAEDVIREVQEDVDVRPLEQQIESEEKSGDETDKSSDFKSCTDNDDLNQTN
jgi:hypothetical protein